MQINISLPADSGSEITFEETTLWLKQLELAVHHAQKSLKEMDTMVKERDGVNETLLTGYLRVAGFMPNGDEDDEGMADRIDIVIYEG